MALEVIPKNPCKNRDFMVFYAPSAPRKPEQSRAARATAKTAAGLRFLCVVSLMRLDYSPAEIAALPAARRSFLIAAAVLVSVGALMSQRAMDQEVELSTPADATTLPATAPAAALAPETLATPAPTEWTSVVVKNGDTLSRIFDTQSLPTMDWVAIVQLGAETSRLKQLKIGRAHV